MWLVLDYMIIKMSPSGSECSHVRIFSRQCWYSMQCCPVCGSIATLRHSLLTAITIADHFTGTFCKPSLRARCAFQGS